MKFIPAILMSMVLSGAFFVRYAHADYYDVLQNGGSIEEVADALGELSYAGSKRPFWNYVRYLNYEAGETEGGRAYIVRKAAAEALGRVRDERGIAPLIERFRKEKNDSVKGSLLFALSFYPQAESNSLIIESLSSPSEDVRYAALVCAATLARKELASQIKPLLSSEKDESMKLVVAYTLFSLGDDAARYRDQCIAGLKSDDPGIRFRAADLIGRGKMDEAVPELLHAMEIENRYWVRAAFDQTLGILYYERKRKREAEDDEAYGRIGATTTVTPVEKKGDVTGATKDVIKKDEPQPAKKEAEQTPAKK
ncbi:MAG TPA: hypothetical protein VF857_03640 [Spirochaetota bacterium]